MTSNEETDTKANDSAAEEKLSNIHTEEEEEYEGRNWNRILMAVGFVLVVVVGWYLISSFM